MATDDSARVDKPDAPLPSEWQLPRLRVDVDGDWLDDDVAITHAGILANLRSLLKRDASHGDSSDIIPGHGGILDRFDSLYFGAPIVYYYLKLVVFRAP